MMGDEDLDCSELLVRPFGRELKRRFLNLNKTLVGVDDDPTGTQTVYDVPVLGHWTEEALAHEFSIKTPLFFVLANTRSLPEEKAVDRARAIGDNLRRASEK